MANLKFKPPQELVSMVADSHVDGKEFELVSTFKQEGELWCLVEVEGVKMPGYKDDEKKDAPEGGEFGKAYKTAMDGGGGMTSTTQY